MVIRFTVSCGVGLKSKTMQSYKTQDGMASAEECKVMGRLKRCVWDCLNWYAVENLQLSAHVGNTPSHFLPPQQNRKQHLAKGFSTLTHEMFPQKRGQQQVGQGNHYSASGLTWHLLAEFRLLLFRAGPPVITLSELFSWERANVSPIMELFKEKGKEVGEMLSGSLNSFK